MIVRSFNSLLPFQRRLAYLANLRQYVRQRSDGAKHAFGKKFRLGHGICEKENTIQSINRKIQGIQ